VRLHDDVEADSAPPVSGQAVRDLPRQAQLVIAQARATEKTIAEEQDPVRSEPWPANCRDRIRPRLQDRLRLLPRQRTERTPSPIARTIQ
jgi:hypothetical protein